MPTIARLPPSVAARIAAGEVVERPAAAVRELIENALDAGAHAVDVRIDAGGLAIIQVEDDGCGMDPTDAPLALARHATSKIRTAADLGHLTTLGYRGEALAALAASADVELLTGAGGDATVVRSIAEHVEARPAARSRGTTVTVYRLFARLPARRAALETAGREASRCQQVVVQYALSHPDVRFRYVQDGRLVFHTPGDGVLRHAAAAVEPIDLVERLRPVAASVALPSGPAAVAGLVAPIGTTGRSRAQLVLALNGRPIQQPVLENAVRRAYGPALPAGRQPIAILQLAVPAADVDPNTHPSKLVPRLAAADVLAGLVRGAITQAIGDPTAPGAVPRHVADAFTTADLPTLTSARWLGQWADAYLVFADATDLYLVDQHAAAERALYEALTAGPGAQPLDNPRLLRLTPAQAQLVADVEPDLTALGFALTPVGPGQLRLHAAPAAWHGLPIAATFADFIADLAESPDADPQVLAARAACHRALRRGEVVTEAAARALVANLLAAGGAESCIHRRPIVLRLPLVAADRLFLRGRA